jgi:hypothetical protein
MGNHSKCELDEFCVCPRTTAAPSVSPSAAQIAEANEKCNNCRGECGTCALELLPKPRAAVAAGAGAPLDVTAAGLMKLWTRAQELATPTMPAPFQFAKLLLAPRGAPNATAPKPWHAQMPKGRHYLDPRTGREEAMVAEIEAWRTIYAYAQVPAFDLQAALEEKKNAVLEDVARWLDWFDGKPTRRAEYVRSLKANAGTQSSAAQAGASAPDDSHKASEGSPQAACGDSAGVATESDPAAIAEARRLKILALRKELVELEAEQYGEADAEREAVIEECRKLKRAGKRIEATKHYRAKTGCGLREAHDFVENLS